MKILIKYNGSRRSSSSTMSPEEIDLYISQTLSLLILGNISQVDPAPKIKPELTIIESRPSSFQSYAYHETGCSHEHVVVWNCSNPIPVRPIYPSHSGHAHMCTSSRTETKGQLTRQNIARIRYAPLRPRSLILRHGPQRSSISRSCEPASLFQRFRQIFQVSTASYGTH